MKNANKPKKQHGHKHTQNKKCVSSRASVLARLSVRLQVKTSLDGPVAILPPSLLRAGTSLLSYTVAVGNCDWQQGANLSSFPSSSRPQTYAGFGSMSWAPRQQRETLSVYVDRPRDCTALQKLRMWKKKDFLRCPLLHMKYKQILSFSTLY